MGSYKVTIAKSAERELQKLEKAAVLKIVAVLKSFEYDPLPYGCRKLAGSENVFRHRVGRYRIIYELFQSELIVRVIKIGHRKDVYRGF